MGEVMRKKKGEGEKVFVSLHPRGWQVKKEGNKRAYRVFTTKKEAVKFGKKLAEKEKGQLLIQRKDGTFQEERTYRKDPYPPKG